MAGHMEEAPQKRVKMDEPDNAKQKGNKSPSGVGNPMGAGWMKQLGNKSPNLRSPNTGSMQINVGQMGLSMPMSNPKNDSQMNVMPGQWNNMVGGGVGPNGPYGSGVSLMGPGSMEMRPPQGHVGPGGPQQNAMMIPQHQQQQQQLQGPGTTQQGNNASGGAADGSGTSSTGNQHITDEREKQNQEHLMLLLHAHKCNRRDSINPKREKCNVPYCKLMKNVLTHMATCKQSNDCTIQQCISSRQILLHYKNCTRSDCVICFPFRQSHAYQNKIGMEMRPPQGNVGPIGPKQNAVMIPQHQQQGPGTSQQGDNASGGAAGGSGTSSTGNQHITDEREKQNQEQLMLLLHAHKCNRRDSINPKREKCNVPYCELMQNVLTHMTTCKNSSDCSIQYCISSRQILLHYKTCTRPDCVICFPFRQSHAHQNKIGMEIRPPQGNVGTGGPQQNAVMIPQQQQQQGPGTSQQYNNASGAAAGGSGTSSTGNQDIIDESEKQNQQQLALVPTTIGSTFRNDPSLTRQKFINAAAAVSTGSFFSIEKIPTAVELVQQQQLMLLLHAHKCNRRDSFNPKPEKCNVPYCKLMKNVLTHMATCKQSSDCTIQQCISSRQILLHYKTCTRPDCVICFPFRQSHAYQNNNPIAFY